MPSYKNSAGNSGIGAEYANWRYFNANLQRLGEYRSPRISGEAPRVVADPVVDWMKELWDYLKLDESTPIS